MMYGILVYKEAEWERAAEESSLAFNAVLRDHASNELSEAAYADWLVEPRSDMQMRILCTEDFAKWFPTDVEGLKVSLVQYAGNCIAGLSPLVVASYLGREFVECCPRTEISRMQLITKTRMCTYDDYYSELHALGKMSPYLAIMGMPLAMAYYRHGDGLRNAELFCSNNGDIASIVCPLRGDFWNRMVRAQNEGFSIRRVNTFKVV